MFRTYPKLPTYEYTLRDHLGNLRIQFSNLTNPNTNYPNILQENHYYAYGSAIPKLSTANGRERYTYNGKELIEDFNINLHNYGARQYDPLTARWNGVDALAEQYHSTTGYGYVGGNPISRIDPDGMRNMVYVVFLQSAHLGAMEQDIVVREMQSMFAHSLGIDNLSFAKKFTKKRFVYFEAMSSI